MSKFTEEINNEVTMDALVTVTKDLADTALDLRQDEKTTNRKVNTIGTALIQQKTLLDNLTLSQETQFDEFDTQFKAVNQTNELMVSGLNGITSDIDTFKQARLGNSQMIETLSELQVEHTVLAQTSDERMAQSNQHLLDIEQSIQVLQNNIASFDIEDQAHIIARKSTEILEQMDRHIQARKDEQAKMSQRVTTLVDGLSSLYIHVERQTDTLSNIETVASRATDYTEQLNDKFDTFLEIYNLTKDTGADTLENVFAQEVTEDVVEEIPEVPEVPEVLETPQKRGFLSRLLGSSGGQ